MIHDPDRWIPISERFPEENGWYLVSFNNDWERVWFVNNKWYMFHDTQKGIDELKEKVTHWKRVVLPEKQNV